MTMFKDVQRDDPLKKCLDYALQARRNAVKIQDFNKEYNAIADRCESFAMKLLDKCTTKHEVRLLQKHKERLAL